MLVFWGVPFLIGNSRELHFLIGKILRKLLWNTRKEKILSSGSKLSQIGRLPGERIGCRNKIYEPGDSKWPFYPLVGGHLTPYKGHLTIPKKVTLNHLVCMNLFEAKDSLTTIFFLSICSYMFIRFVISLCSSILLWSGFPVTSKLFYIDMVPIERTGIYRILSILTRGISIEIGFNYNPLRYP